MHFNTCLLTLLLFLLRCQPLWGGDADTVWRRFLIEVHDTIGADPKAIGSQDEVLKRLDELGQKHLVPEFEALHVRARNQYLQLPWLASDEYPNTISLRLAREEAMAALERVFGTASYGMAPFDYHVSATLWWDPVFAARTIQSVVQLQLTKEQRERRRYVEQFLSDQIYRQSDDAEKPVVVFFANRELLIIKLTYSSHGIYCLDAVNWLRIAAE